MIDDKIVEVCEVVVAHFDGMEEWLMTNSQTKDSYVSEKSYATHEYKKWGQYDDYVYHVLFFDKTLATSFRLRWDNGHRKFKSTIVYGVRVMYHDGFYEWMNDNDIHKRRYKKLERYDRDYTDEGLTFHVYFENISHIEKLNNDIPGSILDSFRKKIEVMTHVSDPGPQPPIPLENLESRSERLAYLSRACGDIISTSGHIIMNGFGDASKYRPVKHRSHRSNLEEQLAEMIFAINIMAERGDIDYIRVESLTKEMIKNPPDCFYKQLWNDKEDDK